MFIDYSKILKKNLKNVLHEVLVIIENKGLKEGHHLYITFDKNTDEVEILNYMNFDTWTSIENGDECHTQKRKRNGGLGLMIITCTS